MPPSMNDPELIVSSNKPFMIHPQSYRGPLHNEKQNTHRPMVVPQKPVMQLDEERLNLRSVVGKVPVDKKVLTTQKPLLRRQTSEPISPTSPREIVSIQVSSPTPERRSIFPNFWKSGQPSKSPQPQRVRSQRSPSFGGSTPPLVPRPSPLMDRAVAEDCWAPSPALPELPSPLQRLHNHSGVYPLNNPKSILRNKSLLKEQRQDDVTTASFNLTRTLRTSLQMIDKIANQSSHSTHSTSSSYDSSNHDSPQHHQERQVKFDPRVTVTELAESEPRRWYSDVDLERFKTDTVVLAKHYLTKHPEQIAAYSQPVHDPVTGTMRKKALFSMPALSDISDEESEGEGNGGSGAQQQQQQRQPSPIVQFKSPRIVPRSCKELLPIQRVLVVDRNEKICNLFCRSLFNIFGSDCEIVAVQSAAAALKQYRGSDIVIAEERLYKPLKPVHSTSSMTPPPPPPPQLSPSVSVPANLGNSQHMSGSQLIAKIKSDPKQKPCLLIGVSTHPLEDSERFTKAGCDLVWGKPPPRMDLRLRNELIALVVAKR